jgi:hypothetical protein
MQSFEIINCGPLFKNFSPYNFGIVWVCNVKMSMGYVWVVYGVLWHSNSHSNSISHKSQLIQCFICLTIQNNYIQPDLFTITIYLQLHETPFSSHHVFFHLTHGDANDRR